MFIGRQEELDFLESCYSSSKAQLVILYGRRRVGKTETLHKFCEGKEHVFYSCAELPDSQQLQAFSARLLQSGMPAARYLQSFGDWQQAFEALAELPGRGKKLLVIDEFPYMVKNNPSIPSLLQNLWDSKLKNTDVMLVLCGSAMSFMEKEILAEKNPLYGRATGILKMLPMNFYDAVQFLPHYSMQDKIAAYAVLGGIPHYWQQFDAQLSLRENITRSILTRGGVLYSEVEFLLRQELRETAVYNTIIAAVALGNTKLNEIFQKTQLERSKLSSYLKNLVDLGILCREFPVNAGLKEQANVQRGLYQVTDNFFRFWYAFVFPNFSELEAGDAAGIYSYVVAPRLDLYTSHIFEHVCREYLRRQNRRHMLPFYFTAIGRWWDKTDELDIVAVDSARQELLLGECKYKNTQMELQDLRHMQKKLGAAKGRRHYYLFSKSGFTRELQKTADREGVALIGLDDLAK